MKFILSWYTNVFCSKYIKPYFYLHINWMIDFWDRDKGISSIKMGSFLTENLVFRSDHINRIGVLFKFYLNSIPTWYPIANSSYTNIVFPLKTIILHSYLFYNDKYLIYLIRHIKTKSGFQVWMRKLWLT